MRALLWIGLAVMLLVPGPSALAAERVLLANPQEARQGAAPLGALREAARSNGSVRVIVGLRVPFAAEGRLKAADAQDQRAGIASAASAFRTRFGGALNRNPSAFRAFETIPFVAMEVSANDLERLAADPEVISISENGYFTTQLATSIPLVRADEAWSAGFSGEGQTIAIIDTGVDKNHPFLAGKVVAEACFSEGRFCPGGAKVSTAPGSGMPCRAADCDHGTHVAGIAAGLGSGFSGVARQASIIAIQGFSPGPGQSVIYFSDMLAAIEHILSLRSRFAIAAVNMSFGGGLFKDSCEKQEAAFLPVEAALANLRSAGIAPIVSSGNDSDQNLIGAPACLSSAVSTGSVSTRDWGRCSLVGVPDGGPTARDKVACYSNSSPMLSLLAPGSPINSSLPGGGFGVMHGTSMAVPHVAGAWAVLKQRKTDATVADILAILQDTGVRVVDHRNNRMHKRIDIKAALDEIGTGGMSLAYTKAGAGSGTVSFSPAGTLASCAASCVNRYKPGTEVTLTASASAGSSFGGWAGACSGTGACKVTMSEARNVTASFASATAATPLTYTKLGTGTGDVVFTPAGTAQRCAGDCVNRYDLGQQVQLVPVPGRGARFSGWSGACRGTRGCVLTMRGAMSVSARFDILPIYTLSYVKAGSGGGAVSFSPSGGAETCQGSCTNNYPAGTKVLLSAQPTGPGSVFRGWTGACSGLRNCSLTMKSASTVTAHFEAVPVQTLTLAIEGRGSISITRPLGETNCTANCTRLFRQGTAVTVMALPAAGYRFDGWRNDCRGRHSCNLNLKAPRSATAVFVPTRSAASSGQPQ